MYNWVVFRPDGLICDANGRRCPMILQDDSTYSYKWDSMTTFQLTTSAYYERVTPLVFHCASNFTKSSTAARTVSFQSVNSNPRTSLALLRSKVHFGTGGALNTAFANRFLSSGRALAINSTASLALNHSPLRRIRLRPTCEAGGALRPRTRALATSRTSTDEG